MRRKRRKGSSNTISQNKPMNKQKKLGQVYTPHWIVCEILDLVEYNNPDILNKYIMEPACGEGAFLLEITRRYTSISKSLGKSCAEIVQNLEEYIYGVEIDRQAYNKCIANLNAYVKVELGVESVKWKIFNSDMLHIFRQFHTRFDYVVGNPPYIRIHNMSIDRRNFIKHNFMFNQGTFDIYLSFYELSLRMINKNGQVGFITPNSFLHNSSYLQFREYLAKNKLISTLIDFKANKMFPGFSSYTAIAILQNGNSKDVFDYGEFQNGKIVKLNEIKYNNLNNKHWSFTDKENEQFLKNLNKSTDIFVKDLFDVQYGLATLRDRIFIGKCKPHPVNQHLAIFNNELIERSVLQDVIKASTFKGNFSGIEKIIYPYEFSDGKYRVISETKMQIEYPHCYAYLLQHKSDLLSRDIDKGTKWYEFGRSQGIQKIHQEKIILGTLMSSAVRFHKVSKQVMMYSGIFITRKNPDVDWKILEDILCSKEFLRFIHIKGKDFSGGYKSISTNQIKEFRVKI